MADTPHPMTDADLVVTLRSPHYDSWVCRLAATRIEELEQQYEHLLKQVEEELGVGLFVKVLTMTDRGLLAEVEETLRAWRRYEDAERPVPRDSPAANADEPEWLRDKLRVLVTRCREIEAERDRLTAELYRLREAIGVSKDVEPGSGDIADYIALRDRGDVLQSKVDQLAVGNLEAQHRGAIEGTRLKAELVLVTDTLREAIEDCADQRRRAERLEERLEHLRHAAELALGFPGPDGGPQTDSQLIGELTAQLAQHEQDIERLKAENGALREWRAQVTVNLRNPGGARFDEVPGLITALVEREVQHERDIEAAVRWGFR